MSEKETKVVTKTQPLDRSQRRNLMILWGSLFGLVVADGVITEYLVTDRFGYEWNPFLAVVVGNNDFLILKAFGAVLVILILRNVAKRNYRVSLGASFSCVLLYTGIIFWNLIAFLMGLF